jgi:two-component system sensor histidine kinase and response regulator WspE
VLEADDLARSIQRSLAARPEEIGGRGALMPETTRRKRVLVVDDSITVREIERKLLEGAGYQVDVASDGMEAWGVVRSGRYDLLITDVDMPRLDGIELLTRVKADPHLVGMPVLVVSYKDREEDRMRGLEAGADYYLTKSSFHGEGLVRAVVDLIGEAKE